MLVNVLAPVTRHEANGSPCDATVDDCWLSFDKPAVELINSSVAAAIPINTTRLMVSLPTNALSRMVATFDGLRRDAMRFATPQSSSGAGPLAGFRFTHVR